MLCNRLLLNWSMVHLDSRLHNGVTTVVAMMLCITVEVGCITRFGQRLCDITYTCSRMLNC